jgi:hypothetical protein
MHDFWRKPGDATFLLHPSSARKRCHIPCNNVSLIEGKKKKPVVDGFVTGTHPFGKITGRMTQVASHTLGEKSLDH